MQPENTPLQLKFESTNLQSSNYHSATTIWFQQAYIISNDPKAQESSDGCFVNSKGPLGGRAII